MSVDKTQTGPIIIERKISQWEELMKKFSEAHQVKCKSVSLDIPRAPRSVKKFPTGSSYEGTWDVLGMSGFGVYIFPNGVIYEGSFEEGQFHGEGELQYESGEILKGKWNRGVMVDRHLTFVDGLEFSEKNWKYCQLPDRRFTIEYDEDLQPAGESVLTAEVPTREIPVGFYDTGDGFYDPKTKSVYDANDMTTIIRSPSVEEQKWIIDNCRTNPDLPIGPRQDLYEKWLRPSLTQPEIPPPAAGSRAYTGFDDSDLDLFEDEDDEPNEWVYNPRKSFAFGQARKSIARSISSLVKEKEMRIKSLCGPTSYTFDEDLLLGLKTISMHDEPKSK